MTVQLRYSAIPDIGLLKLVLARKPGLSAGAVLPQIEARCPVVLRDDPAYRALCGEPPEGPLPLALPFVLAGGLHKALLAHPDFPLPAMGLVHLRQTLWAKAPLQAGRSLELVCRSGAHRPARRGVEFDFETALYDGDACVWAGTTTAWSPKAVGHGEAATRPPLQPWPEAERRPIALPEDMGRRYGRVSGDFNPIHWHALTARPFGFKRAIVHGMWSLARCLADRPALAGAEGRWVSAHFLKPAPLPSALSLQWSADGGAGRLWRGDTLVLAFTQGIGAATPPGPALAEA